MRKLFKKLLICLSVLNLFNVAQADQVEVVQEEQQKRIREVRVNSITGGINYYKNINSPELMIQAGFEYNRNIGRDFSIGSSIKTMVIMYHQADIFARKYIDLNNPNSSVFFQGSLGYKIDPAIQKNPDVYNNNYQQSFIITPSVGYENRYDNGTTLIIEAYVPFMYTTSTTDIMPFFSTFTGISGKVGYSF